MYIANSFVQSRQLTFLAARVYVRDIATHVVKYIHVKHFECYI